MNTTILVWLVFIFLVIVIGLLVIKIQEEKKQIENKKHLSNRLLADIKQKDALISQLSADIERMKALITPEMQSALTIQEHINTPSGQDFRKMKKTDEPEISANIEFTNTPDILEEQIKEQFEIDMDIEYVEISTAGDENVCPICSQFEGKVFPRSHAPKLPLCPHCSCAYIYYFKSDLPSDTEISDISNFVLPAECVPLFHKHQQKIQNEKDIAKIIRMCEIDLKKLPELIEPYISADFPAPNELACRDLLPDLYMQIGKWEKAETTIEKCIAANAYYPKDGSEEFACFKSYKKIALETLSYISQNPGCLQRNIYKTMGYDDNEKEYLKHFLRSSNQIEKVKHSNTYQLFCKSETM